MCWPKDSTPWMADWDSVKEFYPEGDRGPVENDIKRFNMNKSPLINLFEQQKNFIDEFKELAPSLDEVEFAGGEPLLDPLVFKTLKILGEQENVKTENIVLKYSTNLSKLNFSKKMDIIELWKKFKSIKLTISIDGDPERNKYIRHGADSWLLKENLAIVRKELGNKVEVKATTTVQALNTPYLAETGQWIVRELNCNWHTSRLQWPKHLHSNVLPVNILEESIKKIKKVNVNLLKDTMDSEIEKYRLETQFNNVVHWLTSCMNDNKHKKYYNDFVNFNKVLDKNRGMAIEDYCPLVLK
jgi:sulfatase maturation enzyme AslB (radical SAM superfamily)